MISKQERYNYLVEESVKLHPDTPLFFIQLAVQLQVKEEFSEDDIEIDLDPLIV